jgi:hypothetical protein
MTQLQTQIRLWILKSIQAVNGPMPESSIKMSVRGAFPSVAFTDKELSEAIQWCETQKYIAGTKDDLMGMIWDLTAKGKIRAQQV